MPTAPYGSAVIVAPMLAWGVLGPTRQGALPSARGLDPSLVIMAGLGLALLAVALLLVFSARRAASRAAGHTGPHDMGRDGNWNGQPLHGAVPEAVPMVAPDQTMIVRPPVEGLPGVRPPASGTGRVAAEVGSAPVSRAEDVPTLTVIAGGSSDVGRVRRHNEDSLVSLDLGSEGGTFGLYAVADGMGGHAAGEVASALTCKVITEVVSQALKGARGGFGAGHDNGHDYGSLLIDAYQAASRAVYEEAQRRGNNMGTTLVAVLLAGDVAYVGNVGDSRAYRIPLQARVSAGAGKDRPVIEQITEDHSVVQRLVAAGQITREQARHHPQRNLITRVIGERPQVEVDLVRVVLRQGDALVLCSDGLHALVEQDEIAQIVAEAPNPQAACDKLIAMAREAGGPDNITAVVVKVAGG